jgi:hypothetical protein
MRGLLRREVVTTEDNVDRDKISHEKANDTAVYGKDS